MRNKEHILHELMPRKTHTAANDATGRIKLFLRDSSRGKNPAKSFIGITLDWRKPLSFNVSQYHRGKH